MRTKYNTQISLFILSLVFSLLNLNVLFAQDTSLNNPYSIGRFSQAFDTYDQTRCIRNDYHKPIYIHDSLNYVMTNTEYQCNPERVKHEYVGGGSIYYVVKLDTAMRLGVKTSNIPERMNGLYLHIAVKKSNRFCVIYSGLGNGEKTLEEILEQGIDPNRNPKDDNSKLHVDKTFNLHAGIYYIIISGFAFRHQNVSEGCMQLRIYGKPVDPNNPAISFYSIDENFKKPQAPKDIPSIEDTSREENNKLNLSTRTSYIYSVTYTSKDTTRYLEKIKYYDGLGRLSQIVDRNITPTFKDLVKAYEYDMEDRITKEWLPVRVSDNNEGNYTETLSKYAYDYYRDSACIDIKYDFLPINREYVTTMPGKSYKEWNVASENKYLFNKGKSGELACMRLSAANTQEILISKSGYYADGELYVRKNIDEQGFASYTFINKNEKTILTRQINDKEMYDTYFVYDDYGNLRAVLPPLAVDGIKNNVSHLKAESNICRELTYLYKYDDFNNCIWKKLPGADPVRYVYDNADQLIFIQDGEQRLKGEWAFSIPDFLGRIVLSGICKNTDISHNNLKNKIVTATYTGSGILGYTLNNFTLQAGYKILSVNFYDNYRWMSGLSDLNYDETQENEYGERYGNNTTTYHHTGLLTGTATGLFNNSDNLLYSAKYYDDRGRLIQSASQNHLEGIDRVYTAYDYVGKPEKSLSKQKVTIGGKEMITSESQTFRYDHAGRLKETRHQLNGSKQIMATLNEYDEVGRLKSVERNLYESTENP